MYFELRHKTCLQARACEIVISDFELGGGFHLVVRFPPPLYSWLVTDQPRYGRKVKIIGTQKFFLLCCGEKGVKEETRWIRHDDFFISSRRRPV